MRYECLSFASTATGWEARVRVPAGSEFFRGHFPDAPILPGVALLAIAHELIATRVPQLPLLAGLRGIRFRNPVRPESVVLFELTRSVPHELTLKASCEAARAAEGTLLFADELPA